MNPRNEREAHAVVFGGAMRPSSLRFKRSLAEAFPSDRAISVQHYLSNKPSHRALRFFKRLVRFLMARSPR